MANCTGAWAASLPAPHPCFPAPPFPASPPPAAHPSCRTSLGNLSGEGGRVNTIEITPAQGRDSMLQNPGQKGSRLRQREGRGRPETSRSQRGFRNKVPGPTPMSLAEPQPRVPSKVQQRLCLDFLTGRLCPRGWRLSPGHEGNKQTRDFRAAPEPSVFWDLSGPACDRRRPRGGRTQLRQRPGWRDCSTNFGSSC